MSKGVNRYMVFLFGFFILFICMTKNASANIAPLKVKPDGVEPLENSGMMIESANITVTPNEKNYKFNCSYTLKGLKDSGDITIGIQGDQGYTLEAGCIENMNIYINGNNVEYKTYDTTKNLSDKWKKYDSPLYFKWYTFHVPVKKGVQVQVVVSYNISLRVLEENEDYPYDIIPFILSTDRLFGNTIGSYKINYVSNDYLSPSDVKVLVNSTLDSNAISHAILSPQWNINEITWEFKNNRDFQDFRLIAMSFKRMAMNFSTGTNTDHLIKWAMLNNDYKRLAETFEGIATGTIATNLDSDQLGNAAYLASEFYSRIKNYDKAIKVLNLPNKSALWPVEIKSDYLYAMQYKEGKKYIALLNEYNKLLKYKEYVLISSYAEKEIGPLTAIINAVDTHGGYVQNSTEQKGNIKTVSYISAPINALTGLAIILLYAVRKKIKGD